MDKDEALREQLVQFIRGGNAHVKADEVLEGIPVEVRGRRAAGSPHSPWELLEHMRIAQWDILEFSRDARHKSPKWPDGYWPHGPEPPNSIAWDHAVMRFKDEMEEMCALVRAPQSDLYAPIPHGQGQTLLREAMLVADHNAYHLGQLVMVVKMLGAWKAD